MCPGLEYAVPFSASRPSADNQPTENARTLEAFVKGQATRGAHRPKRRSNKLGGGISNHKGVHYKQRNNKFVARLCLPGGKNRKLDLGEYNSHDAAACAYRVGAFYYNKPLDSISEQGQLFFDCLPYVPDNLSDADKLAWVREKARQHATSGNTSEKPRMHRDGRGDASTLQQLAAPGPAPTIPASAGEQYSSVSYEELQSGATLTPPHPESYEDFSYFQVWNVDDAEKQAVTRSHRVSNMPVSELRMTDPIIFAISELRKQGWEWTAKLRSPSPIESGVLFSLPQSQQAAPPLVATDAIIRAFYELREQGWEVHLKPMKCNNIERPAQGQVEEALRT